MRRLLLQLAFRAAEFLSSAGARFRPAPPPGRILVLTAYSDDIADYGDLSAANKQAYARRHGYHFRALKAGFDPDRPPAWSKIRFIAAALRDYDWVFWTDADALVMNTATPLERFIVPGRDIVLTETATPYRHINTGHMLFRSSVFARLFLWAVWRLDVFTHDSTWEQRAVNHLVQHFRFTRLAVEPNRTFNAFAEIEGDPAPYQPGDFIVHFPGLPDKLARLRRFATQVT